MLEMEDDGKLFGTLSLYVIENELTEIQHMIDKLNRTTKESNHLMENMAQQVDSQIFSSLNAVSKIINLKHLSSKLEQLDKCIYFNRALAIPDHQPTFTMFGSVFFLAGGYKE